MPLPPALAVVRSAEWLAHRYDPGHDAIRFRFVPRTVHARATFLTDEHLGSDEDVVVLLVGAAPPPGPVHFTFHPALCLSTLIARAFGLPGRSMESKETAILDAITGWRQRHAVSPQRIKPVVAGALRLLARPFALGDTTIVMPFNSETRASPAC